MATNKRTYLASDVGGCNENDDNPLLTQQQRFLNSLSPQVRSHFFSSTHVTPAQRADVWEKQADLGETLVNSFAWATPDPRLLKIFQHFGPIIEVGCGANAYWSKWMNSRGGVDVVALDASLEDGGKLSADNMSSKSAKKCKSICHFKTGNLEIRPGGPESLSEDADLRMSGRTLFLCYPDEEDYDYTQVVNDENEEENGSNSPPTSMAAACLEHFTGSTVIHVGELYGDTLSFDQAPFGRSSSREFSQRLATEYHCILRVKLQSNWLHVTDSLSVWKRSETCCITFQDEERDEDNDSDDNVYYKYIPPDEVLPIDCAAPCVAHLLCESNNEEATNKEDVAGSNVKQVYTTKTRRKKMKSSKEPIVAGNAW